MAVLELTIAEKIVITRKRLEETQEIFGARFSVKKLTVNQWESGASTPTQQHLDRLKELFQVVLGEQDGSQLEIAAYQLLLPFDQPVNIDFHVAPHSAQGVRLAVEIRRKVS
jgi:transcriptional regulator with XRE-family HTH domain